MVNLSDEVKTTAFAVSEDLKHSDTKSDTMGKIVGDLTNSKEQVMVDAVVETGKNSVLDALSHGGSNMSSYATGAALK